MSEQLALPLSFTDGTVRATLDVLVTLEGKERGGPGCSVPLRMSEEEWRALLLYSERSSAVGLVRMALQHATAPD
jgi:hypothetical protein